MVDDSEVDVLSPNRFNWTIPALVNSAWPHGHCPVPPAVKGANRSPLGRKTAYVYSR